jgi:hypothetical protein
MRHIVRPVADKERAVAGHEPQDPEVLTAESFARHVGKPFRFAGSPHVLTLDRIEGDGGGAPSPGFRRPFILIFRGPREREILPEGFYECEAEGGARFSLYVGPVLTPAPDRQEYQAAFN